MNTPSQKWRELKAHILQRIEEIDERTPWKEVEPQWWLEMMSVARELKTSKKKETNEKS